MMDTSLPQVICLVASLATLVSTLSVLGRMNFTTDHLVRAAYLLISTGSFGEIVVTLNGHNPGIPETLLVVGLGILCVSDRRCSALAARQLLNKSDERNGGIRNV